MGVAQKCFTSGCSAKKFSTVTVLMSVLIWLSGSASAQPADGLFTPAASFNSTNRLVSTSVFQWFTATGGQLTGPWRPVEGRSSWTGSTSFWRTQIKQMMAANFDMLYVHLIPSSEAQRVNLFQALNQLRREGWNVPKVAPFLDPMITWNGQPPVDVNTAAGKDTFVSQYIRWFNQYYSVNQDAYADDYLARIGGRPVLDTWHVFQNLANLSALSRADVETRLRNTFAASHPPFNNGIYMVTTALNEPTFSWANEKVPQFEINQYFYAFAWGGLRTVQLKGGYWDQNIRNPGDFLRRNGGLSYSNAWRSVNRTLLSRVYVESWNEYDEGSGIYAANTGAPYIRSGSGNTNTDVWSRANDSYEYIKTTARGAAAFNDWPERDAKILWHDIPARMLPGETRSARVIVRNEGDGLWSEAGLYRFGQRDSDPVKLGAGRYLINSNEDDIPTFGGIFRGRAKTFTLSIQAPATPGRYTNHWSMLRENVAWFGQELALSILVDPAQLYRGTNQAIDSTGLFTNIVDDFTEHTYAAHNLAVGGFAEATIRRTFAAPIKRIKVSIVSGTADDIGYVGNILVTPNSANTTCRLGLVTNTVDVTGAVSVSRNVGDNIATLTLRARDTCCCDTGWGEDTASGRANAKLHWEVELAPPVLISPVYSNSANGRFYALLSPATWTWSERASLALGGHLTTIRNQDENSWVTNMFSRFGGTNHQLWIGINDVAKEGTFGWAGGQMSTFTFWAPGEPNNALTGEDFAAIYPPNNSSRGRWNDWGERVLDGNGPFNGVLELEASRGPLVISRQPFNRRVNVGAGALFSVAATSSRPLRYQWRFNGTNILNATGDSLLLANVQYSQAGFYSVLVSDDLGSVESTNATLIVNHPPVVLPQSLVANEDMSLPINLAGSDADGDALGFTVLTLPEHGQLSGAAPALIYSPNSNYNGPDGFTFKANDGLADSLPATISINVSPVNDPPVAYALSVSTEEDNPLPIILSASDPDPDETRRLMYFIIRPPEHGTLVERDGIRIKTYRPNPNYFGPDSFTFKASDGQAESAEATVTITVNPINDPPLAHSQRVAVNEDTPLPISLTASDVDGDALAWTIVNAPAHGSLSGTAPNLTYLAATNYSGPDSFTFMVNDGQVDSGVATVSISVNPVNDAPVTRIAVSPLVELPGITNRVVIAAVCANAEVVLDASGSSDVEDDPLEYFWIEGTNVFAQGLTVTNDFEPGIHELALLVSDGTDATPETVAVEVVTPSESVAALILFLAEAQLDRHDSKPLIHKLQETLKEMDHCHAKSARNHLREFQKKLEKIEKDDPALAEQLFEAAQAILDAVGDGKKPKPVKPPEENAPPGTPRPVTTAKSF